ncbi:MAG: hypothetical protein DME19_07585 [Verrucomicrobia bacterium]|nr:MAG: hypothetical protein DME19_07585 [Verrucomicrobiota bacterium]
MLKAIGFWRDTHGVFRRCPRPQWLVQRGWHAAESERILRYLRSGHDFAACCGWSTCRFRGCREGERNGAGNFTDGEWYWPEGLAHYVQRHAVILPEEFIETMRANDWRVPAVGEIAKRTFDYTFWLDWAGQQQRQRWYHFWRLAFYRAA